LNELFPDDLLKRKGTFAFLELAQILRSWITDERFSRGEKLPTESQLMAKFGVGRHTVRAAIANLVTDGLVERFAGRGTFVKKIDVDMSNWRIRSLEDIIDQNFPEDAEIREMRQRKAVEDSDAMRALGLAESDTLVQLTALRRKYGKPYTFSKIFMPLAIGEQLGANLKDEITDRPLVRVIERKCGLRCARAVQKMTATSADAESASLLNVPVGSPLIALSRTYYTTDSFAFEHVRLLGVPELYCHTVEFSRAHHN